MVFGSYLSYGLAQHFLQLFYRRLFPNILLAPQHQPKHRIVIWHESRQFGRIFLHKSAQFHQKIPLWHFLKVYCTSYHSSHLLDWQLIGLSRVQQVQSLHLLQQNLKKGGGRVQLQNVAEEKSERHVEKKVAALSGVVVLHLLDDPGRDIGLKNIAQILNFHCLSLLQKFSPVFLLLLFGQILSLWGEMQLRISLQLTGVLRLCFFFEN